MIFDDSMILRENCLKNRLIIYQWSLWCQLSQYKINTHWMMRHSDLPTTFNRCKSNSFFIGSLLSFYIVNHEFIVYSSQNVRPSGKRLSFPIQNIWSLKIATKYWRRLGSITETLTHIKGKACPQKIRWKIYSFMLKQSVNVVSSINFPWDSYNIYLFYSFIKNSRVKPKDILPYRNKCFFWGNCMSNSF